MFLETNNVENYKSVFAEEKHSEMMFIWVFLWLQRKKLNIKFVSLEKSFVNEEERFEWASLG